MKMIVYLTALLALGCGVALAQDFGVGRGVRRDISVGGEILDAESGRVRRAAAEQATVEDIAYILATDREEMSEEERRVAFSIAASGHREARQVYEHMGASPASVSLRFGDAQEVVDTIEQRIENSRGRRDRLERLFELAHRAAVRLPDSRDEIWLSLVGQGVVTPHFADWIRTYAVTIPANEAIELLNTELAALAALERSEERDQALADLLLFAEVLRRRQ